MDTLYQKQLMADYRRALADQPEAVREKASEPHSYRYSETGLWIFCDSQGRPLNSPPDPIKNQRLARRAAMLEKRCKRLELMLKRGAIIHK